jgi:tRNA(Ile2) C34 agmatinyltransferase TiaS
MTLKQLQQEMEKELTYVIDQKIGAKEVIYIVDLWMQKVADIYEQKKYWCPACEEYQNVKDDGDICCSVCGIIITSYE